MLSINMQKIGKIPQSNAPKSVYDLDSMQPEKAMHKVQRKRQGLLYTCENAKNDVK